MLVFGTTVRTPKANGRLYPGLGEKPHPGVLVLHGGGGARGYEQKYAALLAEHGYTVLCVEYFGAPGIRDALRKVPLEEFSDPADWLLDRPDVTGDQVCVVGFSRGGEALLLVGSHFETAGVVAYVPSCYVWPAPSWMVGVGENEPSWTLGGEPVPHLPIDSYVHEEDGIDEPLGVEEPNAPTLALQRSTDAEQERARIPVENIAGPVLLVSGEQDTVWPSAELASRAAASLAAYNHQWRYEHCLFPQAGHAIRVPYESAQGVEAGERHQYGGTQEANARASACAWKKTLQYLDSARWE